MRPAWVDQGTAPFNTPVPLLLCRSTAYP